jgi:hypothetical protein
MRRLIPLLLAVAAVLVLPQSAAAAAAFDLGQGRFPDIAVDASGAAHIVWDADTGTTLRYCQVPRGADACSVARTLTPPAEAIGRSSYVFLPAANRVVIATHRCCTPDATLAYESHDNGQTFTGPVTIGDLDMEDAVYGPGDAISGVDTGGRYQRMPLAGPQVTQQAILPAGFSVPTASDLALLGGARPFKVSADGDDTTFSVQSGSGDPNDAGTWTAPAPVAPAGAEPHVAGRADDLAMIYRTGSPGQLHARRFDGPGFGVGTVLSFADPIEADLAADVGGRFHAAWVENGVTPNEVRIADSPDGATWSRTVAILRGPQVDDLFHTQVAAAPDGFGFVVFDGNGATGRITAAPLQPFDENDPVATARYANLEVSFFGPHTCLQPPERVNLRVTSKRGKRLSPNRRVKITSVAFSVDRKKVSDRRAAFKAGFSTAGFERGSQHSVRAVVTLVPVKGGKAKKKTLKGSFGVCG